MMMMMMMKTNDKQIGTSFYVCLFVSSIYGTKFFPGFQKKIGIVFFARLGHDNICVFFSGSKMTFPQKKFFHEFFIISFNFLVFFSFCLSPNTHIDLPVIVNMGQIHFSNQNNNVFCL